MKAKVTVIIPINGIDGTTYKCLDSILKQTVREIEIICIDETGDGDDFIDYYIAKDDRVKKIGYDYASEHSGINYAVEWSKGNYISIVNSRDYLCPNMYEEMLVMSNGYKVDVIVSKYYERFAYEDGNTLSKFLSDDFGAVLDLERGFMIWENPEILWGKSSIWSKLFRTEYIRNEKLEIDTYYDKNFSDRYQSSFVYSALLRAGQIVFLNNAGYCHIKVNEFFEAEESETILQLRAFKSSVIEAGKLFPTDFMLLKVFYAQFIKLIRSIKSEYCENIPAKVQSIMYEIHNVMNYDVIIQCFNSEDQLVFFESLSPNQVIQDRFPKILIYNWLPYDNPWGNGGGVTVYCKNIINEILERKPFSDIYFLSSGFCYDSTRLDTYIRTVSFSNDRRIHQLEIVNSPVPAEQRWIYKNPLVALENDTLKEIFRAFLVKYGPFEAIHFNNIEGISLDVLDLKKEFRNTRFIYSMHNYVPLCVNGSYYMRHKHCNCNSNHTAEDCYLCTRTDMRTDIAHQTYLRGLHDEKQNARISEQYWIDSFGFSRLDQDVEVERIVDFAKMATEKINLYCDKILTVSKRVYEIAADNSFDVNKMIVSYIGTKVAERQIRHSSATFFEYPLKIVFLGNDLFYEEKGYPFLMDALSSLPIKYASKIDLLLTVNNSEHAQMYEQLKNYHDVKIVTGYTHKDFGWIFKDCHLSIVPVLWEDNLPQIAIESVAYGVPVLASSAGGASELTSNAKFKFICGDLVDFHNKLKYLIDNPDELLEYWEGHSGLVTLESHIDELFNIYGVISDNNVSINSEDWKYMQKERLYLRKIILDKKSYSFSETYEKELELESAIKSRDKLQYILDETRKSFTYKLGMALTFVPRKIKEKMK